MTHFSSDPVERQQEHEQVNRDEHGEDDCDRHLQQRSSTPHKASVLDTYAIHIVAAAMNRIHAHHLAHSGQCADFIYELRRDREELHSAEEEANGEQRHVRQQRRPCLCSHR